MQLVIDANILVAAFLKAATTRNLLLNERLELCSPEHLLIEARKVLKSRLLKKEGDFPESNFDFLFDFLTTSIKVIPMEEYEGYLQKALEIAPHEEDAPYLALAVHLNIPIWSNDIGMKEQSLVRVLSTMDLIEELKKTTT